jgi:hypothetical protein
MNNIEKAGAWHHIAEPQQSKFARHNYFAYRLLPTEGFSASTHRMNASNACKPVELLFLHSELMVK